MTINRSKIIRAAVICAAVVFAIFVVFTHLPRSMEFTVTVYKYEENADGDNLPNFDKPIEMVCSLRRWKRWLSGDVLEGSVQIGDKVYSSNNYLFWHYSPVDATELNLAYGEHTSPDNYRGKIAYQTESNNLAIHITESQYTRSIGNGKSETIPGDMNFYISETVGEDIAEFFVNDMKQAKNNAYYCENFSSSRK